MTQLVTYATHNKGHLLDVVELPFVSKLVEKVVAKHISTYVDENAFLDPFQSAYRCGSCTFETIYHELVMIRFEHSFGITDKAHAWLQSYISERYQKVAVGSANILRKPSSTELQFQSVRQILIQIQFRIVNSDCGALNS